jgi:DUF177 domain-containing protein
MRGWPVVDSLQFARKHGEARCSVGISELARLAPMVSAGEGEITVRLDGFEDLEGRPGLRLRVAGSVDVVCQRCLDPIKLDIDSERSFLLAAREQDLPELSEEDEDVETILADASLDALALAEDEILLQIPMAPRHEDGQCSRPEWTGERRGAVSAFGALGALMGTED